jgi:hypothetical protein
MRGERGLARAAFLVEQCDDLADPAALTFWKAVFGCSDCLWRGIAHVLSSEPRPSSFIHQVSPSYV